MKKGKRNAHPEIKLLQNCFLLDDFLFSTSLSFGVILIFCQLYMRQQRKENYLHRLTHSCHVLCSTSDLEYLFVIIKCFAQSQFPLQVHQTNSNTRLCLCTNNTPNLHSTIKNSVSVSVLWRTLSLSFSSSLENSVDNTQMLVWPKVLQKDYNLYFRKKK